MATPRLRPLRAHARRAAMRATYLSVAAVTLSSAAALSGLPAVTAVPVMALLALAGL